MPQLSTSDWHRSFVQPFVHKQVKFVLLWFGTQVPWFWQGWVVQIETVSGGGCWEAPVDDDDEDVAEGDDVKVTIELLTPLLMLLLDKAVEEAADVIEVKIDAEIDDKTACADEIDDGKEEVNDDDDENVNVDAAPLLVLLPLPLLLLNELNELMPVLLLLLMLVLVACELDI
jgi:hypothetical protein